LSGVVRGSAGRVGRHGLGVEPRNAAPQKKKKKKEKKKGTEHWNQEEQRGWRRVSFNT
jgi:hypothetical protein